MTQNIRLGIVRETKVPIDRRVPLTPKQARLLLERYNNIEIYVQPSKERCYSDAEYQDLDINLREDLSNCDILMGVKEINLSTLISGKTYYFFSHISKKQEYNRILLQRIIKEKISLVDYEHLTNKKNIRLVAFGFWAGIVGSYNGLIGWGLRTGKYKIKPANNCRDMKEMFHELANIDLGNIKILVSGGGRVAHGAIKTLNSMNLKAVSPNDFLNKTFDEAVYTQIDPDSYVERIDGKKFDLQHFFNNPTEYKSSFLPFTKVTDIFIACHFWDKESPVFMTNNEMNLSDFKIQLIADVSCDIAKPIPSTLRASTINNPFYGYNPDTGLETEAFGSDKIITVMAVDNLPAELPRDASADFGDKLMSELFPAIFGKDEDDLIERATIVKEGKLTEKYSYLQNFADGK